MCPATSPLFLKILSSIAASPDWNLLPPSKEGSWHNYSEMVFRDHWEKQALCRLCWFIHEPSQQANSSAKWPVSRSMLYISTKGFWIHEQRGPSSWKSCSLPDIHGSIYKSWKRNFPCSRAPGPIQWRSWTLPLEGIHVFSLLLQAKMLCLGKQLSPVHRERPGKAHARTS